MSTILCIDDDPYLADLLRYALVRDGFDVLLAHTGRDGLQAIRSEPIDLVILDVNLPDVNGFKVLASLRAFSQIPVVMLTGRAEDRDVVTGLGQGADDYVAKPFSMEVLVTRVRAVLRRSAPHEATVAPPTAPAYHVQGAVFIPETNEMVSGNHRIKFTPTESRILQLLFLHEGQVLSAERIMERIWGYESDSDVNVIKTHIRHLREKISALPGAPKAIETLPGAGYVVHQTDEHGQVLRGSMPGSATH